jgi:hypothetical protein
MKIEVVLGRMCEAFVSSNSVLYMMKLEGKV